MKIDMKVDCVTLFWCRSEANGLQLDTELQLVSEHRKSLTELTLYCRTGRTTGS